MLVACVSGGCWVDVTLQPSSTRYPQHDDRWLAQVADLVSELNRVSAPRLRTGSAVKGAKGAVADIIVSLGSAGVFTGVVQVARGWLGRDSGRAVKVTWFENGSLQSLELTGSKLDESALAGLKGLLGPDSK
jgi:hypothetical protein